MWGRLVPIVFGVACGLRAPDVARPVETTKELPQAARTTSVRIVGRVVDAEGAPVEHAWVGAFAPHPRDEAETRPRGIARTDADGRFELALPPGAHAITATARERGSGTAGLVRAEPGLALTLALATSSASLGGIVRDVAGRAAAEASVRAVRSGDDVVYQTFADPDGRFTLALPEGDYFVLADTAEETGVPSAERIAIRGPVEHDLELAPVLSPPTSTADELVESVRAQAIPLATMDPGHDAADLAPFVAALGDVRVLAIGEATHGTREFFRVKHRMLEALASHGFTVFALETSWARAQAIDDYVVRGKGDAETALAGLSMWPWDTEELLELVEWMRRYNASPRHPTKLRFAGFDVQGSRSTSARALRTYLRRVDRREAQRFAELLATLEQPPATEPTPRSRPIADELAELARRFDAQRTAWIARSSAPAWATAEHHVRVLMQGEHLARAGADWVAVRDRYMAENVLWLAEHFGEGARLLVSAHNGHVSFVHNAMHPMGMHLRAALGPRYLAIGMLFGHGAYQAMGEDQPLHEIGVAPPDDHVFESLLRRVEQPAFIVDLRTATGPLAEWSHARVTTRQVGYHAGTAPTEVPLVPAREFDALLFVDTTTRARPTEHARRRFAAPRNAR